MALRRLFPNIAGHGGKMERVRPVFHLHSPFFALVDYRKWQNASPFIHYETTFEAIRQKNLRLFGGDDSESRMTFFKEAVHAFSGDGHRVFMMNYDLTAPNNPV